MVVEPYIPRGRMSEPDYNYYADRLAKSLSRITDVFDWDEKALKSGKRAS